MKRLGLSGLFPPLRKLRQGERVGRCSAGRHVVRDGRMTCDCAGVSLMRDDEDVLVMVYEREES